VSGKVVRWEFYADREAMREATGVGGWRLLRKEGARSRPLLV
jgi:hypothetical protein